MGGWGGGVKVSVLMGEGEGGGERVRVENPWQEWGEVKGKECCYPTNVAIFSISRIQ